MLKPIEVNFKLDKTIKRAHSTELMIKSHDIKVIEFHISFDGLELTADHTVKVLSVFNDTKSQTNINCDIADGKAIYRPDTSLISQSEHVQNYVYVYHGDQSLDVREFLYSVSLSKIDETALKVKEVYDQSYAELLANFEQALEDYKDSLPQASDLRAEIDVILNQFKTDSDAKLNQYDADAQQVIADNQTAFDLAESNRQSTYEQAEDSRNQASEQAVFDWEQGADALVDSKLIEMQTNASTLINGAIDDFNMRGDAEIVDWRASADIELEEMLSGRVVIRNRLENGDFSDSTTLWRTVLGTLEMQNGIATFTPTANFSRIGQNRSFQPSNRYYHAMRVKASGSNPTIYPISPTVPSPAITGNGNWETTSVVHTPIVTNTEIRYVFDGAIGVPIQIDWIMQLNLTEIFGEGNEPTKSEMDELIKITGYFDEITLTQKQLLNWQLKLMRQNRNALIALGGTII